MQGCDAPGPTNAAWMDTAQPSMQDAREGLPACADLVATLTRFGHGGAGDARAQAEHVSAMWWLVCILICQREAVHIIVH